MDETSANDKQSFAYTIADESVGPNASGAKIKVIGVGGGGGNVINYIAQQGLDGVELIAANTDVQDLNTVPSIVDKVQLGAMRTRGLGAGMDPAVGSAAAQESVGEIEDRLRGADMLFLIACMGGGTGTGASPVIAEIAREMSILTVAVVTMPFSREQEARTRIAQSGTRELHGCVDALITIPNDKLRNILGGEVLFSDAYDHINAYLAQSVRGIADIVNKQGVMNLDFADVKSVLSSNGKGVTVIGIGTANGQNRAEEATMQALKSPLLDETDLTGARNALFNIRTGKLKLVEYEMVSEIFDRLMQSGGRVWPGVVEESDMEEDFEVTVLVTGIEDAFGPSSDVGIDVSDRSNWAKASNPGGAMSLSRREGSTNEDGEDEGVVRMVRERGQETGMGRRISASDIPSLFRDQAD